MKTKQYAAIVLAAGFSRRMCRLKPLLSLGNETIADHLMTTFLQNSVSVYLVVGYRQDALREGIKMRGINIVDNPDYELGMFSSIQAGIRSLKDDYKGAFIAPVDTPLVSFGSIRKLLRAADDNPGKVIHPTFQGDQGHPPLIPAELFPVIASYPVDGNLKSVFQMYRNLAFEVEVPDSNILFDVDEPADYQELLKRFQCLEGTLTSSRNNDTLT